MLSRQFSIIVAATKKLGIGFQGDLPWNLKGDKLFFKQTTTQVRSNDSFSSVKQLQEGECDNRKRQNAVIMGRKTWESLPEKSRPLPNRINIILTRHPETLNICNKFVFVCTSLNYAVNLLCQEPLKHIVENVFVIGGSEVYAEAMKHPCATQLYFTHILDDKIKCDVFFPPIDEKQWQRTNQSEVMTEVMLAQDNLVDVKNTGTDTTYHSLLISYRFETYTQKDCPTPFDSKMSMLVLLPNNFDSKKSLDLFGVKGDVVQSTSATDTRNTTGTTNTTHAIDENQSLVLENYTVTNLSSIPIKYNLPTTSPTIPAIAKMSSTNTDKLDQKDVKLNKTENNTITVAATTSITPTDIKDMTKQIKNSEEQAYLNVVKDVLETGIQKNDRTGVGTLSKFGTQMRFSLRNGQFPLLTTKTVFWKGVVEELLWILRGCTDSQALSAKKVKIWDGNGSRSFLDNLGFKDREVGDLGPVYGFQWRHFGAKYIDTKTDYKGQGVDQIADVMHQIKTNPDSRRIFFSAWNPLDLKLMALPPCHVSAQFTVANGELSCLMTQRSCDLGLGIPFNIASYSLLTVLMAHACGLKPGEFIHSLGDYHVYNNHVKPLQEQLKREPRPFPTLKIKCQPKSDLALYTLDDLDLVGYQPHTSVKMEMAV